mmetsp:Transcript_28639/g.46283  ORF Transcript_28639/g.46283 Transcript_28639/m.46283 type:complete len:84 (+) Transcript_28639:338-589(+)
MVGEEESDLQQPNAFCTQACKYPSHRRHLEQGYCTRTKRKAGVHLVPGLSLNKKISVDSHLAMGMQQRQPTSPDTLPAVAANY